MNTKNNNDTIVILADKKNHEIAKKISNNIAEKQRFNVLLCISENDFIDFITNKYKKYIYNNQHSKMIVIDDFGILPFMAISKLPFAIVAQLEDEHSAHMTKEHNNSNVITLGSSILGFDLLVSIIDKYLLANYEGGRHKVRLDMLDKMLEKEKI